MLFRGRAGTFFKIMREEISNQVNISNKRSIPVNTLIPIIAPRNTTYFTQLQNSPTASTMCTLRMVYWMRSLKRSRDSNRINCSPTPISCFLELTLNGTWIVKKNIVLIKLEKSQTISHFLQLWCRPASLSTLVSLVRK